MEFAVIDNNKAPMVADRGRGLGFVQALPGWTLGKDYEFVRYEDISPRRSDLMRCRGLILSGSAFDFALPNDGFDRGTYETMTPVFQLMRDFTGPVLGICFGHQLMALAEEFDPDRTDFGQLRIRNMRHLRDKHMVLSIHMDLALRFMNPRDLWVQFHHKQDVLLNDALLEYFDISASSDQCPVQIMQHKSRDWFGVQFHPETGVATQAGEMHQHLAAVRDGQTLLQGFVHYCLR